MAALGNCPHAILQGCHLIKTISIIDNVDKFIWMPSAPQCIGSQYCNVSLNLKRTEILHILFSHMIETSQKCLFDLVMLYAKVHDSKRCNAQIGEGWW